MGHRRSAPHCSLKITISSQDVAGATLTNQVKTPVLAYRGGRGAFEFIPRAVSDNSAANETLLRLRLLGLPSLNGMRGREIDDYTELNFSGICCQLMQY